jgi:hypothetical protein
MEIKKEERKNTEKRCFKSISYDLVLDLNLLSPEKVNDVNARDESKEFMVFPKFYLALDFPEKRMSLGKSAAKCGVTNCKSVRREN